MRIVDAVCRVGRKAHRADDPPPATGIPLKRSFSIEETPAVKFITERSSSASAVGSSTATEFPFTANGAPLVLMATPASEFSV